MKDKFLYNPYEISIAGHSGTGKSTLICQLIEYWAGQFLVGYAKSSHHRPEKVLGKDTDKARKAGAYSTLIAGGGDIVSHHKQEDSRSHLSKMALLHADFCLIEGHKGSTVPKLWMDEGLPIPEGVEEIKAIIYQEEPPNTTLPSFHRDDISNIATFILKFFAQSQPQDIVGLVLAGGKSSRMGSDKGQIIYHGKRQAEHALELIGPLCNKSYISCDHQEYAPLPTLPDQFREMGPVGAILTGLFQHPHAGVLVLACDTPLVTQKHLEQLVQHFNPFRAATAFLNPDKNWPEPLITIYSPKAKHFLLNWMGRGIFCPRKTLMNTPITSLIIEDGAFLANANTPEDKARVEECIKQFGV